MASGRQFQSSIVCGKNEMLKTSLFAYGMRNLNWWLPLVRLSECWIKYFLVFISIRPWVSLYISVTLDCLLLVSSVAHPKSFIMSVILVKTVLFYIEPFPEHWYLSLTTGPKPHLHIPASVVLGMYMQFFTFFEQFQRVRCIVPNDLFASAAVMENGLSTCACYWW